MVPSALLFACSGDNATGNDGGGDATTDVGPGNDAAPDVATPDSGGGDAGSDATSTGDAGDGGTTLNVTCTNPTECDGGAYCCGTIALNGGTPPNCSVGSVTTACAAQCNTVLQFSCNASEKVRLCNQPSDCTEQNYNKCCTFQTGNVSTSFCANTTIATAADAGCM